MPWFSRRKRVLTVGSVHLDTIAVSAAPPSPDEATHIGNIIHSVGGSAFNIAANLAGHRRRQSVGEVAIYSILPRHSVLTEIIKYKIDSAGVDSRFIRLYADFNNRHVRGGGYVGIVGEHDRLIRQAVVDAAMYEANIFMVPKERAYLESAIAWADLLVLDCDLAVSTVDHIAEHARDNTKPLFISVGSPPAGLRSWVHSHEANFATCLSGRLVVLRSVLERLDFAPAEIKAFADYVETGTTTGAFDINAICRQLKTRHLVCCNVRQSQGFALFAAGANPYRCFFATPEDVRARVQRGNSAGVVDGALAGFIQAYAELSAKGKARDGELLDNATQRLFSRNVLGIVEDVSESEGATRGSVISFEEQPDQQTAIVKLWRLTKIAFDILPVFRYVLSIAALIIALYLVDLSLDVLSYFGYHVELPDKPWMRMLLRR